MRAPNLENDTMLTHVESISVTLLKKILPKQGNYIAAITRAQTTGGSRHSSASTIEELWTIIENADRDGLETYHTCASFKEALFDPPGTPDGQKRLGRTKHNILGLRVFRLDIDVGPGKAYRDQNEALDALKRFCLAHNLPPPIVVSSGSGLHVYWPLAVTLDPEAWKLYATGLKNLCVKHGLHADHAVTTNSVAILRTPGTHNRKRSKAQLVECAPEFLEIEPYPIERFKVFLDHADVQPAKYWNFTLGDLPPHLLRTKPPEIVETFRALRALAAYEPVSGAQIAEHCEQVRALRDSKGCLQEPLWYAVLGVFAFCEDGDELGHECSSGYEGYTERETQERLDRARTLTGATTCARFHELNPAACERCPHWGKINSPIVLGRQPAAPADTQGAPLAPVLTWERTHGGALKPKSYVNAALALVQLGINCRHDFFHNKKIVEGDIIENLGPELSDPICRALRDKIIGRFSVDPGIENVQQAAERACEANRFNPVVDYLDSRQWDGQLRLDRWFVIYLGADDTPLNRSIGRKMLIASVRRARQPGCKFDDMVVLEGPQGSGKSSALRILAGEENFSDQPLLHLDTRAQQEAIEGVWIYEISELVGLRRTETEKTKGFLSKTHDNARPAYGRHRVDRARNGIFVGTTNDSEYLRDWTGNRRIQPVKTGKIDLEALRRDRDPLWAEAAAAEAQGEPLVIPENLYAAAAHQ